MEGPRLTPRQSLWLLLGSLALVIALAATAAFWRPAKKDDASLNVPLGVEQAAIVTYSGPALAVAPYKWGVAVNVRIAAITERADARIYDVRYIVNREGTFDLKDYLTAADGRTLTGLPSFQFRGDPKLSKNLDNRIQETEEIRVEIGGHYRATLAALALLWVVWLLLLIFYKRGHRRQLITPPPAEPTVAALLRGLLAQLKAGTLDAAAQARLEMLLLRRWREELALEGTTMTAALASMAQHEKTREPLHRIQTWIHQPTSGATPAEIAALLAPHTIEPPAVAAPSPP
jgi:hypothetical protein